MINVTITAKDLIEKVDQLYSWYNPIDPDYTKEKIIRKALEKYYIHHVKKQNRLLKHK